ncbi:phospho-sugar mutase [Mycoplasmopsis phocirhinis]|uniref:Phospho-sugar mutase n=1 Tax=Mycoplasmopsis phocirhinis TaxID=142650 RepID=A0A4V0ZAK1_9BACT|nr:phospho-sugar mutase [Mycoplasmopsis phocirhinis]
MTPLDFGTAGIRGIVGKGINRLSRAHVQRIAHGYAKYLLNKYIDKNEIKIVIGRDSRRYSYKYASVMADIFSQYDKFKIIISKNIIPTPFVSYLIIKHDAQGGINITASHNPYLYNGIKLYNNYGAQCLPDEIKEIKSFFKPYDNYSENYRAKFPLNIKNKIQTNINQEKNEYINQVLNVGGQYKFAHINQIKFVYSNLHGAGLDFALAIFKKLKFRQNIDYFLPQEQIKLDKNFPTCPFPNPELIEVYNESEKLALKYKADAIIVTDPDADRIGVKIKHQNEYILLNGNETATLIFDFILKNTHNIKPNSYLIYSYVSSNLPALIAQKHGINSYVVPTGFKWISKFITQNQANYLYGFEESYGSLIDPTISRDKDAIQSIVILLKMIDFYKQQSKTLVDILHEIYQEYGYMSSQSINVDLTQDFNFESLQDLFKNLNLENKIVEDFNLKKDYMNSNMIKIGFDNNNDWIALRPSGTEPKVKFYIFAYGHNYQNSIQKLNFYQRKIEDLLTKLNQ